MSAIALGLDRTVLELKMYFREKEAVFFSFLFPILHARAVLRDLRRPVRRGRRQRDDRRRLFLPGMVAAGVLLTSFQTMAMSVAAERDDGTLKRLRATPMPPVAYFLGKVGLVAITSLGAVRPAAARGAAAASACSCPRRAGRWAMFAWVFAARRRSAAPCSASPTPRWPTARTVGAVVIGPMLVLQFISGRLLRLRRRCRSGCSRWPRSSR